MIQAADFSAGFTACLNLWTGVSALCFADLHQKYFQIKGVYPQASLRFISWVLVVTDFLGEVEQQYVSCVVEIYTVPRYLCQCFSMIIIVSCRHESMRENKCLPCKKKYSLLLKPYCAMFWENFYCLYIPCDVGKVIKNFWKL